MKISEIFFSIQGEGKSVGNPAVFVRLQNCNLKCSFCDSKYTWNSEEGIDMIPEEVRNEIEKFNCKRVVFTGGEPLLQQEEIYQVMYLLEPFYNYEIETNGTILPTNEIDRYVLYYNVSPKLKNSGNSKEIRYRQDVLDFFSKDFKSIFKFVVEKKEDIEEVITIVEECNVDVDKVYLIPQGIIAEELKEKEKWLVEVCKDYKFNYSPRLQIEIWGNKRGV